MKRSTPLSLVFVLPFAVLVRAEPTEPLTAAHEFHASNEFALVHNDISGPGKASSSLTQGLNYLEVLNIYGNGKTAGGWAYNYAVGGKVTDDRTYDAKTVSLVNANARAAKGAHTLTAGDTFESFSQYALATALKGGSYKFARQDSYLPEVTAVVGWAYPRWDSAWKDPETRSIQRRGTGVRVKQPITSNLWAAASYVDTKDTKPLSPTDELYDGHNATVDFGYAPIPGLSLSGERSQSNFEETTSGISAKGSATRVEIIGDADPSRVTLEYENVDPEFYSTLGSATSDRRKFKGKWRYKASPRITVTPGLLWFRDNLNGAKTETTRNWKPELGVAIKRPFASRPRSHADLSYRFDRSYGGATSAADHTLNANYRDRHGPVDSDTNVNYTLYSTKVDVRDASEINFNTTLSGRHAGPSWVWKPSLKLGVWQSNDDLSNLTDNIYEYSAGLGMEVPKSNLTGDLRFGQNMLRKEGGDDSDRLFATFAAYWRPHLIAQWMDSTLFLRANYNDFGYTTTSRNYREKSVGLGLNTSF